MGCVKQLPTKALHYGTSSRIRPGAEIGRAFDGTWHHATPKTSAQNAVNMTTDNTLYDRFADTWWDEREWRFVEPSAFTLDRSRISRKKCTVEARLAQLARVPH